MPAATQIPPSVNFQKQLTALHVEDWMQNDVFTIKWFLLIGLAGLCLIT